MARRLVDAVLQIMVVTGPCLAVVSWVFWLMTSDVEPERALWLGICAAAVLICGGVLLLRVGNKRQRRTQSFRERIGG